MLVTKESHDSNKGFRPGFTVGETVHVVSLGRTGNIVGRNGGAWLVRLTEGDSPVPCAESDLEKRQTLLG